MMGKKYLLVFLAILIAGSALRLAFLGRNSLWYDEAVSLSIHLPFLNPFDPGVIKDCTIVETQGPLYYYLLIPWSRIFSNISVFFLRAFSAAMNILTMIALYLFASAFFSRKAALWSVAILAFSPLHLWYSQEIKGYTLATLLALLSVIFLVAALEKEKRIHWAGFILFSFLSITANYQTSLILSAAVISLLVIKELRDKWRAFLTSCAIIVILLAPVIFIFVQYQLQAFNHILNWRIRPPPAAVLFTFFEFNLGYNATILLYFISALAVIFIFLMFLRQRRLSEKEWIRFKLIASMVCFSIILAFAASQVIPFYLTRYLLAVSVLYYLLIGVAIENSQYRYKRAVSSCLIALLAISCLYYYRGNFQIYQSGRPGYQFHHGVHRKDNDLEEAMEVFNRNARNGDILAVSHQSLVPVVFYYSKHYIKGGISGKESISYLGQKRDKIEPLSVPAFFALTKNYLSEDSYLASITEFLRNYLAKEVRVLYLDNRDLDRIGFKRLWLLVSSWDGEGDNYDRCSLEAKKWCDANLERISEERSGNIGIVLYKNPAQPQ